MNYKTIQKIKNAEPDIEELEAYGFVVERKQPWHWRIMKPDHTLILDVWPTVKKLWIVGSQSSASIYSNLFSAVMIKFNSYDGN